MSAVLTAATLEDPGCICEGYAEREKTQILVNSKTNKQTTELFFCVSAAASSAGLAMRQKTSMSSIASTRWQARPKVVCTSSKRMMVVKNHLRQYDRSRCRIPALALQRERAQRAARRLTTDRSSTNRSSNLHSLGARRSRNNNNNNNNMIACVTVSVLCWREELRVLQRHARLGHRLPQLLSHCA